MTQIIGVDIGRGYVKAYSIYKGQIRTTCFKSTYSEGRKNVDLSKWNNPISIKVDGLHYFMGEIAVKEGYSPLDNSQDSKTSSAAETLLMGALSEVVVPGVTKVKLMFGVPNRSFNKKTLGEVTNKYKNKHYTIKDYVCGEEITVGIEDVGIFRESDAALMYQLRGGANKRATGMVTVGYRTTELAYFEPGMKFIDRKSGTEELGNKSALEIANKKLELRKIKLTLSELDLSTDYEEEKKIGYKLLGDKLIEVMDNTFTNLSEMDIYIGGGTSKKIQLPEANNIHLVEDPQMITAKGLFTVANLAFNR